VSDSFELDRKLAGTADAFFLEVKGDSMEALGILEGDLVLVEPVEEDDLTRTATWWRRAWAARPR
jgi:SOS-response transcriptional repressor LexA